VQIEKEEHAWMLYRVETERTREGEMKGDNGQEGPKEKTEGQWGRRGEPWIQGWKWAALPDLG